jgi:hypothetical protein
VIDSGCGVQKWENVLLTDSGWYSNFDHFDESTLKPNIGIHCEIIRG